MLPVPAAEEEGPKYDLILPPSETFETKLIWSKAFQNKLYSSLHPCNFIYEHIKLYYIGSQNAPKIAKRPQLWLNFS